MHLDRKPHASHLHNRSRRGTAIDIIWIVALAKRGCKGVRGLSRNYGRRASVLCVNCGEGSLAGIYISGVGIREPVCSFVSFTSVRLPWKAVAK